jgi:4-hydroxy-tetrahydrodipicolinate synthase
VTMPVSVILRCLDASGARAVKLEDPPTPPKIAALLAAEPGLSVFGGLGGVAALSELRRGACGTMTGFAYPEILGAVRRATEGGDRSDAARVFDRYLPLIQFEGQPGIGLGIRKEVLRRRGAIATATTRLPPGAMDPATAEELADVLDRVGIRPGPEPLDVDA